MNKRNMYTNLDICMCRKREKGTKTCLHVQLNKNRPKGKHVSLERLTSPKCQMTESEPCISLLTKV